MKATLDIVDEPRDDTYRHLLDFCARLSTSVLLVVRESVGLNAAAKALLLAIEPFKIEEGSRESWPGTTLYGHTAIVRRYRLAPEIVTALQGACNRLYGWQQPALPEDPCFIRSDGSVVLTTIAHEQDAFLSVDDEEMRRLGAELPALRAMLHVDEP